MAATAIAGVSHYIGTAAERAALSTTGLPAGSTFYETDTPALYIYGGAAWTAHIATVKTGSNVATVGGSAAHDAAAAGNPVQVGGVYRSADPAVADGDVASLRVNAKGEALVSLTGSSPADGKTAGAGDVNAILAAYNGANYDRWRGNVEGTLLASAARLSSIISPTQTNYNARGVILGFNVTAASGTGGVQLKVWGIDPVTGSVIAGEFAKTGLYTTTGHRALILYPGAAGGGSPNASVIFGQTPLQRRWSIEVYHGDGSSYTYSVSYSLIL